MELAVNHHCFSGTEFVFTFQFFFGPTGGWRPTKPI
jgi:hypothetical protein